MHMKKFIVLQKIGSFPATVVREFDDEESALKFAGLMSQSEENKYITYYIASNVVQVPF